MAADPTDVSDDRSGDRAPEAVAVQELYERHAARVYSFCLHQLGNREEAEDATQSTFLNAFRGLRRGVAPVAETAWLLAIARNVCLTRVRSTVRRRRLEAPRDLHTLQDTIPARAAAGGDELLWLGAALSGLPENQRRAILLREWQGLSYDEIAVELGTTHGAVETLIFRGRRTLARRLEVAPGSQRVPQRAARWLDFGAALGWAKALLAGGTAKAVATATVVATVAVAGSAPLRHDEPPAAASTEPPSGARTVASAPSAWAVLSTKASNAPARVTTRRVAAVRRAKPTPAGMGSATPPPTSDRTARPIVAEATETDESPTGEQQRRSAPRAPERKKPTETPEQTNDSPPVAPPVGPPTAPPERETERTDEEKKEKQDRQDRERRRNDDDDEEEREDEDDERENEDDEREDEEREDEEREDEQETEGEDEEDDDGDDDEDDDDDDDDDKKKKNQP